MPDRSADLPARRSPLVRDVAVLVLAGVALGVTFNALQAAQHSPRALSWLRREPKLASFESLAGALPPAAPVTAGPGVAAPNESSEPPTPVPVARENQPGPTSVRPSGASSPTGAPSAPAGSIVNPAPASGDPSESPARPAVEPVEGAGPAASTAPLPDVPVTRDPLEVGVDFTRRFHEARAAVFVDARSAEEYAEGHIAGSSSLPFDDVYKHPELAKQFDSHGVPIIVYCGGGDCDLARTLAYALIEAGHKRVLVFREGLPGWVSAGLPTAKGAKP